LPQKLTRAGYYDLRVLKGNRLVGCGSPIGLFPGQPKYGCSGDFSTATTCNAAYNPVKDTKYVAAVHRGCETEMGHGTYGYAYDDGVGLRQCSPKTRYEWVLCPYGSERSPEWSVSGGIVEDSLARFRITNKCQQTLWIQQSAMPYEAKVQRIEPGAHYTYSIPNKGLPSTRFTPKVGCDDDGNSCDVQSLQPCPEEGCDLPIDTKFEASWGCAYARGKRDDGEYCALTPQGNPSTYQDWWGGSAVDGWTLPFSILVNDDGQGLSAHGASGSPSSCSPVVCADLDVARLCPRDEFLTPES